MRGSPIVRFILLCLMLALTGLGLVRLTSVKNSGSLPEQSAAADQAKPATQAVPFRLLLSAPATEIEVNAVRLAADPPISGILEIDPKNPRVALVVHWQNPTLVGEHRFAKLTLEAPGQETLTHVFDAAGDIDDFIELPFPAAE